MSSSAGDHQRRYRRRIIGVGAALFVLTFLIPLPFMLDRVEDDLEDRVTAELTAAGVDGVMVSFSGQDGTIECEDPLADPDAAESIAEGEWGVRRVTVDASCFAIDDQESTEDPSSTTQPTPTTEPTVTTTGPTTTEPAGTDPTTTVATTTPPGPEQESIGTLIADDPQFSQLAGLLADSGVDVLLDGPGPFTLFAPDDLAFDATFDRIGPDAFAALTTDPDAVEQLVLHHVSTPDLTSEQLEPGPLEMLDGESVTVGITTAVADDDPPEITIASGDIVATVEPGHADVLAANGVVHAVDSVLLPPGLDLVAEVDAQPDIAVDLVGGRFVLTGRVATEAQQSALVAAAGAGVEPENLDDQLVLDPAVAVTDEDVARLTRVVGVMVPTLAAGTVTSTGGELEVTAVPLDDAGAAAIAEVAAEVAATTELQDRPVADDEAAAKLQSGLNDLVALTPITFEPNSAVLTPESAPVVERVAGRAKALGGVTILVVGHTDSDGRAATNQALSEQRAASVVAALAGLGLDPATLTSEGRGATEPVLVDGVEDKAASRRVEFVVRATTP